jgi:hypothetical protein
VGLIGLYRLDGGAGWVRFARARGNGNIREHFGRFWNMRQREGRGGAKGAKGGVRVGSFFPGALGSGGTGRFGAFWVRTGSVGGFVFSRGVRGGQKRAFSGIGGHLRTWGERCARGAACARGGARGRGMGRRRKHGSSVLPVLLRARGRGAQRDGSEPRFLVREWGWARGFLGRRVLRAGAHGGAQLMTYVQWTMGVPHSGQVPERLPVRS